MAQCKVHWIRSRQWESCESEGQIKANLQFGLAAIALVAFPAAMFFRIHYPHGVLVGIMLPVTFCLVIGYVSKAYYRSDWYSRTSTEI